MRSLIKFRSALKHAVLVKMLMLTHARLAGVVSRARSLKEHIAVSFWGDRLHSALINAAPRQQDQSRDEYFHAPILALEAA